MQVREQVAETILYFHNVGPGIKLRSQTWPQAFLSAEPPTLWAQILQVPEGIVQKHFLRLPTARGGGVYGGRGAW